MPAVPQQERERLANRFVVVDDVNDGLSDGIADFLLATRRAA